MTTEGHEVKSYVFKIVIEEDRFENGERAYHAHCPALKGWHTWGHTHSEALSNIREAIELYVEDLKEAGEPIPVNQEGGPRELHQSRAAQKAKPSERVAVTPWPG